MKQIYTLVRPVLDYEESETTFAAFFTEAEANAARAEIITFWKNILEEISEIGEEPDFHLEGEGWEVYKEWADKRIKIIHKFSGKWPLSSEDIYRADIVRRAHFFNEAVEVRAIPLYSTVETYK